VDLYEHQGKDLFDPAGIPLPERAVATTPDEAAEAAERLGGHVAVKVQVQMGGRGKGGGVALVHSPEEAARACLEIMADPAAASQRGRAGKEFVRKHFLMTRLLRDKGAGDVLVFGGGIIPKDDIPKLAEAGIEKIFTPGASTGEIVEWLNERLSDHQVS